MLVKFNDNNLSTTFVKSVVTATPLPIYDCIQDGDFIIEGCYYIYHGYLIRCTVSGTLDRRLNDLQPGEAYVNTDNSTFLVLDSIAFGEYKQNVTRKETCPNSYYDNDTHRLLGKYLRMMRSYFGIDLMSMYNVYDGTVIEDMYINSNKEYYLTLAKPPVSKVLWVPIKYNTKYTIYVDSSKPVKICPAFRNNFGIINHIRSRRDNTAKSVFDAGYDSVHYKWYISEDLNEHTDYAGRFDPIKISDIQFKKPYVWDGVKCDTKDLYDLQNYLGLIIQLDRNNTSSVVVLEGDTSHESRMIFNAQNISWLDIQKEEHIPIHERVPRKDRGVQYILDALTQKEFNSLFRTPKQLTLINDRNTYAFNEKIISFFVHHVITNMEMIEGNIGAVQEIIPNRNTYEDIWDDRIRVDVYNKFLSNYDVTRFDVTGYIDAEVERYLNNNKVGIMK